MAGTYRTFTRSRAPLRLSLAAQVYLQFGADPGQEPDDNVTVQTPSPYKVLRELKKIKTGLVQT